MIERFSAVIANLEDRPDYLYAGSEPSPSSPNRKEQKGLEISLASPY
jgi:hypothetical protein